MDALFQIASKVEAAVEAYVSIKNFADAAQWKANFKQEMVRSHLYGVSICLHFDHSTFEIERCHQRIPLHNERKWGCSFSPAPHFSGTSHCNRGRWGSRRNHSDTSKAGGA